MVRAASPPTHVQTAARSALREGGRAAGGNAGHRHSEMENELHPKALRAPRCFFQTALEWDQPPFRRLRLTRDRGPGPVLRIFRVTLFRLVTTFAIALCAPAAPATATATSATSAAFGGPAGVQGPHPPFGPPVVRPPTPGEVRSAAVPIAVIVGEPAQSAVPLVPARRSPPRRCSQSVVDCGNSVTIEHGSGHDRYDRSPDQVLDN